MLAGDSLTTVPYQIQRSTSLPHHCQLLLLLLLLGFPCIELTPLCAVVTV